MRAPETDPALRSFLLLAFALSWIVAWPLAASARGWIPLDLAPALHLLIGFGPGLAALAIVRREGVGARAWLKERLRSRGRRWIAFGILAPAFIVALTAALAEAARGLGFAPAGMAPEVGESPIGFVFFFPIFFLTFGLGEELGWRGYLLPKFEARFSPRVATLALAGVWALWHLPLVVDPAAIGKGGAPGLLRWGVGMVAGAFILTWLYHRGGVLACALFHGSLNAAATIVADPLAEALFTFAIGAWAVALAASARPFVGDPPQSALAPMPAAAGEARAKP